MDASRKRWAFVDYENQPQSLHFINQRNDYSCVLVFFGVQQKVTMEFNKPLTLQLIRMENVGKNNLDFHLSYYLGKYDVKLDKRIAFDIFTKDTGFDHLIKFIQQQGRNCQRIEIKQEKTVTIQRMSQIDIPKIMPLKTVTTAIPPLVSQPVNSPVVSVRNPHLMPAVQRVLDNLKKVTHRPKTQEKLMNTITSLIRSFQDNSLSSQLVLEELCLQKKITLHPANKLEWHF